MQYCNVNDIKVNQQWCFYQKSFSTRIIPFEYCNMNDNDDATASYFGPSPISNNNVFNNDNQQQSKNIVMKDNKVILETIQWSWDFSNSNWLLLDEFF